MSNIQIHRHHGLDADEARRRIDSIAPMLKDKYGVSLTWSGQRAEISGRGVSGFATVDATDLELNLKLSLLLRPLAGVIRGAIEKSIDEALAAEPE